MNIFTWFQKRKTKKENPPTAQEQLAFPIFCKLHAVKSPDHQGGIIQSRIGDKLLIVHTPNAERPYCTSVYNISLNRVLGFIEDELAERLTKAFGENFCRDGEVEQITGGPPYKYYGCNVRVMESQHFVEDMKAPTAPQDV